MNKKRLILCTHNNYEDPFLQSQLLEIYRDLQKDYELIVFIKKSNENIKPEKNLNFIEYGYDGFYLLNYFRLLLKNTTKKDTYHLRGFVSAIVFWSIHFWNLNKIKYIYDPRGSFLDEFFEKEGDFNFIFGMFLSFFRRIELALIKNSKITIVTTEKFKKRFSELYGFENKYIVLYNASYFKKGSTGPINKTIKNTFRFCYVGSINFWHDLDEILRLAKHIVHYYPNYQFSIFTNYSDKNFVKEKAAEYGLVNTNIEFVKYYALEEVLQNYNLGISVVKPTLSSRLASPIKVSDFINLNIPFIQNLGIGDFDRVFEDYSVCIGYEFGGQLKFDKKHIENLKTLPEPLKSPFKIETNRNIITQIITGWN